MRMMKWAKRTKGKQKILETYRSEQLEIAKKGFRGSLRAVFGS